MKKIQMPISTSTGSSAGQDDLNIAFVAGQVDAGLIASAGDGGGGQEGEVLELVERELMDCHGSWSDGFVVCV